MKKYTIMKMVCLGSCLLGYAYGGTVSYWQMDDATSASNFVDAVGSTDLVKHTGGISWGGVAQNPIDNPDTNTFSTGTAADNTNSYLTVRANTTNTVATYNMTGSSSWTFEGWFNWTGNSGTTMLGGTRGIESSWNGWELTVQGTGRIDVRMQNSGGSSVFVNTGSDTLPVNDWTHIALVWDHDAGANGTASIYFDGWLVGSGVGNGDLGGGAKAFYVGARDGLDDGIIKYNQLGFSGHMDELRFSDTALNTNEFLTIPADPPEPPEPPSPGPVSYWQLDESTASGAFEDAVGGADLVKHSGGTSQSDVGAHPVPNPDTNTFSTGSAAWNSNSYETVRANISAPVTNYNMTGSSSWTFEGWYKWSGNSGTTMLGGTRGIETTPAWTGWEFEVLGTTAGLPGRVDLRMTSSVGAEVYVNSGANAISVDTWVHIALVWDHDAGANGTVSIYLDGVLANSGAGIGNLAGGEKAFYIGGRDGVADGEYKPTQLGFSGRVDEVRFSAEVLSPAQFLNAFTSHYDSWLGLYPGVGAETNKTDNPDGDSLSNFYEWGLGGDPSDGGDIGHVPSHGLVDVGGTNGLEYVYAKRNDAATLGLSYNLERSTNLTLPPVATNDAVVGVGTLDSEFGAVTNWIPTDIEDAQFLQLIIEN